MPGIYNPNFKTIKTGLDYFTEKINSYINKLKTFD